MAGESIWPEDTPAVSIGCTDSRRLTTREKDILRELAKGSKYEEIAEDLSISVNTVKYHVKNLLLKTGYKNTLQLVAEVVGKRMVLPGY